MKRIMKNTILWVFALLLWVACYDDKGSYDYHDINEVAITLPETQNVRLPKKDSVLVEITPELKQTLEENESNLSFSWERQLDETLMSEWRPCGAEKVCRIYIKPENVENIRLRLTLKDNQEGTIWYKETVLKVIQPYSNTWFVLQNDGGKAVLGAIDGEGTSSFIFRDVYQEEMGKELPIKGVPLGLVSNIEYGSPMSFFPDANPKQRAIMVMTDQDMEVFGASTFEKVWALDEMLMQGGITFSPRYLFSREGNGGGEMLINDGKLYSANMDGYSIYHSARVKEGSYRARIGGYMMNRFFIYDEENHRFLNHDKVYDYGEEMYDNKYIRAGDLEFVDRPITLSVVGENIESDKTKNVFDPDRIDPNLKMVSMDEMSSRGLKMLAFAYHASEQKVHVFEFSSAGWMSGDKDNARCSGKFEIPFPEGAKAEELCFTASAGFNRIFFMAHGNKIYKVDLNRSKPKVSMIYEHEQAGVKVTKLKCKLHYNRWSNDEEIPLARVLGAVLDYGSGQGGLVEMQLNTAGDVERDVNRTFEYKGFGNIVDFCYTLK